MKAQIIMVKLLLNCRFSKQNKGFVISLDAFFAILLLLGVISYLGIGMQPTEQPAIAITTQTNAKQILDDAITAMDNNGFIGEVLVDDSNELTTAQAQKIYERLKQLLPSNMDLNIKITRFEPVDDLGTCRGSFEFDKCFKTNPETVSVGIMLPQNNEVFYGNQLFMKRQPYIKGIAPNTCILESQLAGKKTIQNTSKALFDEAPIITTKVSVTDNAGNLFSAANKMQCFDSEDGISNNEAAIVTMQEKSGIRPPVSIITVMDISGTMSKLDMPAKTTIGSFNSGTCAPDPPGTCSLGTVIPNNCNTFSGWITNVGSFNITTNMLSTLTNASDMLYFWNNYTTRTGGTSYQCSSAKMRAKKPGTSTYYYQNSTTLNNATNYAYLRKDNPNLIAGNWQIELWADQPTRIDRPLWAGTYMYWRDGTIITASPTVSNQTNCTAVPTNGWTKIGEFTISDNRAYNLRVAVSHNYNYPEGVCGLVIRLKKPDASYSTIANSKNSPVYSPDIGTPDNPLSAVSPFNPLSIPTGTYEVEAWSDREVTITKIEYEHRLFFGKIEPITISTHTYPTEAYPTVSYNNGLCGSPPTTCTAGSTIGNNCGSAGDYSTTRNYALLGSFNVSRSLHGLRADISSQSQSYTGACNYPRYSLRAPTSSGVADTNTNGQPKPETIGVCLAINRNTRYDSGCNNEQTTSSPIAQGNWSVYGWSDATLPFSLAWKKQKLDAAIEAAETFVNNESLKTNDKMGIVSYSDNATLNAPLTALDSSGKNSLVGTLNSLAAGGETNIGGAIAASTTALVSSLNTKFIVLMSDGQANKPEPAATAVAYAIQKVDEARSLGITLYTIGFGSDVAATDLKDIAKDPCNEYEADGKCKAGKVRISGSREENLVGYWKFDGGSGITATDSSGNGNNGTLINGPTWQTMGCKNGNCLSFDGVNDYVNVGRNPSLNNLHYGSFTISMWFYDKKPYNGGWDGLFYAPNGYLFRIGNASSQPPYGKRTLYGGVSLNSTSASASIEISQNNWTHFVGVFNNSTKTLNLYINGQEAQYLSHITGSGSPYSDSGSDKLIGYDPAAQYTFGLIDELKIYNRALTADEILQEYNGSAPAGPPKFPDCFINNDPGTLTIDPAKHCGRYYFAGDPQTLQQVYDLIAREIGIALSNVKIVVNPASSELVCKCNNVGCATECDLLTGNWVTSPITFNTNLGGAYTAQSFKARLDCNGSYCEKSTVEFPPIGAYPVGTFVQYGETAYEWGNETGCDTSCDCNLSKCVKTIDFLFRDLGIKFTGGAINDSKVSLDFNIQNNGLAAITPSNLQIGFYKDQTNHLRVDGIAGSQCQGIFPPNNCIVDGAQDYNILWQGSAIGAESAVSFKSIPVNGTGYIKAVISGAKECPLHNESKIYCLADSKVYYFKIEYSAWVK